MVERLQITHPAQGNGTAVVVDLDGTLLRVNSWPLFARALMRSLLRRGHLASAARLAWKALLRKAGRIDHRRLKYAFGHIAAKHFAEADLELLLRELCGYVAADVMELLAEYARRGAEPLLATAAAAEYSRPLGRRLGFTLIAASSDARCASVEEYVECKGAAKVAAVDSLLEKEHLRVAAIITDHHHDLPLLQAYPDAERLLVRPGEESLRKIEASLRGQLKIHRIIT